MTGTSHVIRLKRAVPSKQHDRVLFQYITVIPVVQYGTPGLMIISNVEKIWTP
jgi:hypothetical protein